MPEVQPVAAVLRTFPGTSSAAQRKKLAIAAKRKGIEIYELRGLVGCHLHDLSSAAASDWITRLSGDDLPNPPGGKPWPYARRKTRDTVRMVTADHMEQIGRLMLRYFENNTAAAVAWFRKNWKCDEPRELGTTERAGEVIAVLKKMLQRKETT